METLSPKPIKMMGVEIEPFDSYDYESIILNFWMHSVTNRMNEFRFLEAFKELKQPIEYKLNEHGLIDYDSFVDNEEQLMDFSVLEQFTTSTNYLHIDLEDIKEAVLKCRYDKMLEAFKGMGAFETLQELLDRIENIHGATIQQKIELFDEIIHAQHETGEIFDDVDIDSLREQAEEEIKEMLNL